MLPETGAKGINKSHRISSYSEVIHMHDDNDALPRLWHNLMKDCLVNGALRETKVHEDLDKHLILVVPHLLEPIQHLLQVKHCATSTALVVARGVMHEEDFVPSKFPIEVCHFNIKLLKLPC
jgi:hypothetical protein